MLDCNFIPFSHFQRRGTSSAVICTHSIIYLSPDSHFMSVLLTSFCRNGNDKNEIEAQIVNFFYSGLFIILDLIKELFNLWSV